MSSLPRHRPLRQVLRQRVSEATEMQSVYGDRRPALIVLDEIDGAIGGSEGTGAINELIRLANASVGGGPGADGAASSPSAKGSSRARKSSGLQRPRGRRARCKLVCVTFCVVHTCTYMYMYMYMYDRTCM